MSDIVRYLAFFSYFSIQLAQLFLCCFADQSPLGKPILEKVGKRECFPLLSKNFYDDSTQKKQKNKTKKKAKERHFCGFWFLLSKLFCLLEEMMRFASAFIPLIPNNFGFLCQECVCVFEPKPLHTFVTTHSLCEITLQLLSWVFVYTTGKPFIQLSLRRQTWAGQKTFFKLTLGSWQVNENELPIDQNDTWRNISPVINCRRRWKSPLGWWWGALRVQKPQSDVVDTPSGVSSSFSSTSSSSSFPSTLVKVTHRRKGSEETKSKCAILKRANSRVWGRQGGRDAKKCALKLKSSVCACVSPVGPFVMTHFRSVCTRPPNVIFALR